MLPRLQLFGINIAMYGLMILIGTFVGISIAVLRGKKYNLGRDDIMFSSCYAGIGLIVGAKLLFIITIIPSLFTNGELYFSDHKLFLSVLFTGFVFYGGLIGAFIGYYIYCRQFHIPFIAMLDLITPSIPLIHAFGRIGCFFAGCCYGITYHGAFHVIFHQSISAPNEVPLLPIQLIESGINLLVSIGLFISSKRLRKPGQIFGIYIIYYAIMRFVIEFYRGDVARGIFFGFSTSQWISLILIPIGLWCYFSLSKKAIKI